MNLKHSFLGFLMMTATIGQVNAQTITVSRDVGTLTQQGQIQTLRSMIDTLMTQNAAAMASLTEATTAITNLQQTIDNSIIGDAASGTIDLSDITEQLEKLAPYVSRCNGTYTMATGLNQRDRLPYTTNASNFSFKTGNIKIVDLLDGYSITRQVPLYWRNQVYTGVYSYKCGKASVRYKCENGEIVLKSTPHDASKTVKCVWSSSSGGGGNGQADSDNR